MRTNIERALFTALVLATTFTAHAQSPDGALQKCVGIENSVQRLACFDAATKSFRSSTSTQRGSGRWKFEREISRIDDSKTFIASVDANEKISGWPGKVVRPTLVLRCMEKQMSVYIITGMAAQVESDVDRVSLTFRLDQDQPFDWRAIESTDREALFLRDAEALMDKLNGKRKLLFRFTPFNSSPALVSFDITGVEKPLAELKGICAN